MGRDGGVGEVLGFSIGVMDLGGKADCRFCDLLGWHDSCYLPLLYRLDGITVIEDPWKRFTFTASLDDSVSGT